MKIIGANLGYTEKGMLLNDGGICLLNDDKIVITSEERIIRKKYSGGFTESLKFLLEREKLNIEDIDLFVFSSCCELPRKNLEIDNIPKEKIVYVPSHHLSHAYSSYFSSKFDEALIMVIDNEGNIINDLGKKDFFENELEHMTYYIGKGNKVTFLERDDVKPNKIGIGDAYRYFTHYIGFPSYVYAGKTMGLAPYGVKDKYKDVKIFDFDKKTGHIICKIENNYQNCNIAIKNFFKSAYNIDIIEPRTPIDDISQEYADLAYLIQKELEEILIKKVKYLVNKTGIKKLCIAGGVGLNSVANGRLLRETGIDDIFIVPAAGDTGQCLGNVYYGYYDILNNERKELFNSPYLGFEYSDKEIGSIIKKSSGIIYKKYDNYNDLNKKLALDLSNGKIIARFDGRSEFGPRALGNRSILMDPRKQENKNILNKRVKFRESFRPFAPSVLYEYKNEYFDLDRESPYMLLVAQVKKPNLIPAVTHVDQSARVQTVKKIHNPNYYDLINEFYKLTDIPVLLNTSFNINGEPIVETPEDALNSFKSTNIDELQMGLYLIEKR
ncbi:MAG: carbamoyltransferase C-terminal domain-containing protein [bacterium]|nr:carbamoyltransferase C-terminal domain-containing protein [bacterium]